VRVHLGPFGAPQAIITIRIDGKAGDEVNADAPVEARAWFESDGWRALIDLPDTAIEHNRLILSIERFEQTGARSTWPRPSMPFQPDPARAIIDLTKWGSLDE
ncbi:MAG TPA: hypothetical protein VG797_08985, partial [Phycisphaerales bacterium]|nr:hypothetical protein [Phycisphaerales bacterium]